MCNVPFGEPHSVVAPCALCRYRVPILEAREDRQPGHRVAFAQREPQSALYLLWYRWVAALSRGSLSSPDQPTPPTVQKETTIKDINVNADIANDTMKVARW